MLYSTRYNFFLANFANMEKNDTLIVDSGSSKTLLLDMQTKETVCVPGINPIHLNDCCLQNRIHECFIKFNQKKFDKIIWSGAGCGTEKQCMRMSTALAYVFGKDSEIEVGSDLLIAARATAGNSRGIVCILGTGSNSGLYDGKSIIDNIPPLGYILGDEGSGAAMGKRLISAILKRSLTPDLISKIECEANISKEVVEEKVYHDDLPNKYLASMTIHLAKHISNEQIQSLVEIELEQFLVKNVLKYQECFNLPIHFVGGVAATFKVQLLSMMKKHGLKCGKIVKSPIDILKRQKY